jgi:NAD(P)H-hydrate epimerase
MTLRPLTRSEVRSIDATAAKELGLPTLVLMENAGRGAAEVLRERSKPPAKIVILCGSGNNGGDGGVMARHLDAWEFDVRVVWFAAPGKLAPDAAAQYGILEKSGIPQESHPGAVSDEQLDALFQDSDWLVDGLLGTGLTRPVAGPLRTVIEAANRSRKPVLALDLPSGMDADSGEALGVAVKAAITVTFVAPKVGFAGPFSTNLGEVRVVEIGVPGRLLRPFALQRPQEPPV